MTLLRRRPREIYRVYSEEEYLNGAGSELASIAEWPADESPFGESELGEFPLGQFPPGEWPLKIEPTSDWATQAQSPETGSVGVPIGELYDGFAEPRSRPVRERRLRRVAGVAVLVGAIGTVGGLVVLNLTRANGGRGGRRGSLVAATSSSRTVRSPAVDDAQPQVISSRPVVVRPVETARSRVQQARRHLGGSATRRSNRSPAQLPARRRAGIAVVADYAPRPSSGEVSAASARAAAAPAPNATPAPAAAPVSTTTASVAPAAASPQPEKRPEFGFER